MVSVLGSTGSIGISTLDVIARHPERFAVYALAANTSVAAMRAQCLACHPRYTVMKDENAAQALRELLPAGCGTEVLQGEAGLAHIVTAAEVDTVMAAIVGAAGLASTLAAAKAGKRILLANKEALVMSGPLLMQAVVAGGATLIPIDSEHNAIFQCMPAPEAAARTTSGARGVRRILLTASGGPFLRTPAAALGAVTPDQACAHPRWVMGRKISVDSATLMNKGLELIEACLLFAVPPATVEIVIHPQSIVHSMVEYMDGSVLAQLGNPDMRTPIAHALGWPERLESGVESLNLVRAGRLDFEAPDPERFPSLRLARAAAEAGGTAPAVLNAANEIAVAAFLERRLAFTGIPSVVEHVMNVHHLAPVEELSDVLAADAWARQCAATALEASMGASA
jgi:1-deoxy-D-xylulose-5-phosphate reductoisomerase